MPPAAFLNAGYYGIFGQALGEAVPPIRPAAKDAPLHLLDAGCGEGWYDRCIAAGRGGGKAAATGRVRYRKAGGASGRKGAARRAVCGGVQSSQPVRTGWADVLLNCFFALLHRRNSAGAAPGRAHDHVVPGRASVPDEGRALRKALQNPVQQVEYPGFRAIDEREVQGTITVPAAQLEALFAMTPYYWKTPRDGAAALRLCRT